MASGVVELAPQVEAEVERLVGHGWFKDRSQVVQEAVRRFVETHREETLDSFVREDIEWGLNGRD